MEGDDGNLSTGGLSGQGDKSSEEKQRRLVVWNVQMLSKLLKKIVAMREEKDELKRTPSTMFAGLLNSFQPPSEEPVYLPDVTEGKTVLDEVQEIITLPTEPAKYKQDPDSVELPEDVVEQLTSYVTEIAKMYRDNPFHSFDHASHVTQSVIKMLSRVVAVHTVDYGNMTYKNIHDNHEQYHDNTYGIVSMQHCRIPPFGYPCACFLTISLLLRSRRVTPLRSSHVLFRPLSMIWIILVYLINSL